LSNELDANGQGAGSGGTITLNVTGDTPMELSEGVFISAKGGDTGDGGIIEIDSVSTEEPFLYLNADFGANYTGGGCSGTACFSARSRLSPADDTSRSIEEINGVSCQKQLTGSLVWPKDYRYCGTTPSRANVALNAIALLPAASLNAMPTTDPTPVFVFANVGDANSWLQHTDITESDSAIAGWVHTDFPSGRTRIQISETVTLGGVQASQSDAKIGQTTLHEVGHVLDVQFGSVVDRAWVSAIGGTDQSSLDGFIAHDLRNLTYAATGYVTELPACGTGAIFEGEQDPRDFSAICVTDPVTHVSSLASKFAGLNNKQILATILPYYFTTHSSRWDEFWAQDFAVSQLGTTLAAQDYYLLNYFPCALTYTNALRQNGALADLAAYPAVCTD
jgi:hypothetical protein